MRQINAICGPRHKVIRIEDETFMFTQQVENIPEGSEEHATFEVNIHAHESPFVQDRFHMGIIWETGPGRSRRSLAMADLQRGRRTQVV